MPLPEWAKTYHTGLQLDFVATHNIEEGEEILLDYGDGWQTAWDQHVEEFNFKEHHPKYYLPSYEVNEIVYEKGFGALQTKADRDY